MRVVFERNAFCLQELSLSLGSAKGEPLADVPIGKHDAMAWDDARSGGSRAARIQPGGRSAVRP